MRRSSSRQKQIRRWDLFSRLSGGYLTPNVVYREVVEQGMRLGYPGAQETRRQLFDSHIIRRVDPQKIPVGASPDGIVLQLAREKKATLYSDDQTLIRRAQRAGLSAFRFPDALLILLQAMKISSAEYPALLLELRARGRIDDATRLLYLKLAGIRIQRGSMAKTREPKMEEIAISIPKELLRLVDSYARKHLEDRSTALRQLVAEALRYREWKEAAEDYQKGRATLWEVAARLGLHYREAEEVLLTLGVPLVHVEAGEVDMDKIEQETRNLRRTRHPKA
ncbi:MAG: hypothetical protein A2Z21_04690 [Candidatus Fraserbacteria bacterium RBG_16_55_9]|uniref:Uncharacterized protein n=1 Tax=Fraserbacteria sp. (strain RBG_16_55_9) TaxID=1817864 RepID=A0A1F5UVA6_FRAXR|nr:MAG: hypothetical protein A2Z21_04690 [Candidatus Fraserbacteria bacterium RBG_16_55_9]